MNEDKDIIVTYGEKEYITKAQALAAIDNVLRLYRGDYQAVENEINNHILPADVKEITYAEWIPCKNKSGFKCSNCKARVKTKDVVSGTHKYCYRCGAEMSSHITICGAYECDGCLYQHRGDIELCKKQKGEYLPWMKTKK